MSAISRWPDTFNLVWLSMVSVPDFNSFTKTWPVPVTTMYLWNEWKGQKASLTTIETRSSATLFAWKKQVKLQICRFRQFYFEVFISTRIKVRNSMPWRGTTHICHNSTCMLKICARTWTALYWWSHAPAFQPTTNDGKPGLNRCKLQRSGDIATHTIRVIHKATPLYSRNSNIRERCAQGPRACLHICVGVGVRTSAGFAQIQTEHFARIAAVKKLPENRNASIRTGPIASLFFVLKFKGTFRRARILRQCKTNPSMCFPPNCTTEGRNLTRSNLSGALVLSSLSMWKTIWIGKKS